MLETRASRAKGIEVESADLIVRRCDLATEPSEEGVVARWQGGSMARSKMLWAIVLISAVAFSASCKKKKPNVPPPAATAPTITQPLPTPAPPPSATTTTTTSNPPATTSTTTTTTPVKPKPRKPKTSHKPVPKPQPATQPSTAPKPNGQIAAPTTPPATPPSGDTMTISPNLPPGDANAQKRDTENLLQAAEANLRKINRTLSDGEQGMVRQVRNYITQSRLAMQDGDLERAHNLAVKAQLLSAELTK